MNPSQTEFLYRAEVKGIQAWILASDRLPELVGGSALIEGLCGGPGGGDVRRLVGATGGAVETAAAGNIELRFTTRASLERFAAAWPLVVASRAPGLQVIQAWAPVGTDEDADRKRLFTDLGAARNRLDAELPEAGPLVARAGRTGLPAVGRNDKKDGSLVDRAIAEKICRSEAPGGGGLDQLAPTGRSFIKLADELGERYLALIHADGNGLGARFKEAKGAERAPASTALAAACEGAAREAIALLARLQDLEADGDVPLGASAALRPLRARPIVVGGDDFTLLVDARYALPVAARFLDAFEEQTRVLKPFGDGLPLTAAAGVALVKTGFPFHAAHALAESLCKAAKGRLRASGESGLLFHRVTTASTEVDWGRIEQRELGARVQGGEGLLSAGPYTLRELQLLSKLAAAMRPLPRGAMRQWLSLSRASESRATALWDRTKEVAKPDDWRGFEGELNALGQARFGEDHDHGWFNDASDPHKPLRRSPIGDALLWRTLQPTDHDRLHAGAARQVAQ